MKSITNAGLVLRGLAMGVAEVIPGVSGGTIAFITGIYKTLLDSIKAVDGSLLKSLVRMELKAAWTKVNGNFLLWLVMGMGLGILIGVFGVSYLLEAYPEVLWSLFFGLILASVPFMLSQMKQRHIRHVVLLLLGAAIAYFITTLTPASGSTNLLYLFLAGCIAISALVLPGISGSFMLVLMGLYTTVIPTVKEFLKSPEWSEFVLVSVFAAGCLTGLLAFSRLVSSAFENYHDGTIALLSGFMLGSLNKIWPWRNPEIILDKVSGALIDFDDSIRSRMALAPDDFKIIKEANSLPAEYISEPKLVACLLALLLGLLLVGLLSRAK